ncbi:MAG: hypothetical protein K8W52_26955 [Deltaproteobacteria bacterium]|nr:hypothetical protein [Deltaproteobacteria bacterium]
MTPRSFALTSLLLLNACVPAGSQPWLASGSAAAPGAAPAATGGAPAVAGAACPAVYACYQACAPLTESCMATCDGTASPGAAARSRATVTCIASAGCADEACVHERCAAETAACLGDGGQVAVGDGSAAPAHARTDGFAFATATFDDGWISTVQDDWVLAHKQDVDVYLYYALPYNADRFTGTGVSDRDYYWDTYVARQFAVQSRQHRDGDTIALHPSYVEGWATDRVTGRRRFLAMYLGVVPNAGLITLVAAPDEETVRAWFPKAAEWQSELAGLARYNQFPIGADDLVGTWEDGSGTQTASWYDANTGAFAGVTFAAHTSTFTFASDGTYQSVHNGASGAAVGPMSTFHQEYRGTYAVSAWSVTATHRFGDQPASFGAHFQAVRGGRLLALDDGRGSSFLLVRTAR